MNFIGDIVDQLGLREATEQSFDADLKLGSSAADGVEYGAARKQIHREG